MESERSDDSRLVTSLPLRRQPAFTDNIGDEFFKLDEEEEEQKRRPINFYTDDIPELDEDLDDTFHTNTEVEDDDEFNTPRGSFKPSTFVPSSMPIEIIKPSQQHPFVDGVERLVPLKKLEQQLDKKDTEDLDEVLEDREQAMFRNMQRLSFSVQPEDGPDRLWGDHSDWEDERRRRRCSFNQHDAPSRPIGAHSMVPTKQVGPHSMVPTMNMEHYKMTTSAAGLKKFQKL